MPHQKTAIITAGGSGMGADAARRLAADGFKVAILSSSGKGEALAKELGGLGVTGSNRSNEDLQAGSTSSSTAAATARAPASSSLPTRTGTPASTST
jgi:NAD(P)-dependent dehydrogenase (short-subunit alcohol dehydrogenase family)